MQGTPAPAPAPAERPGAYVVDTVAGPNPPDVRAGEVDGTGTDARFNNPYGITTDGTSLFVTDTQGNTIRRIR
jgi:hypothetical protein